MGRDITQYWRMNIAEADIANRAPYFHSAGSVLKGARLGDRLWIVTSNGGRLCLVQTFVLTEVGLSRAQAARRLGVARGAIWDDDFHVIGEGTPTWPNEPLDVHDLVPQLRFVSKTKPMLTIKEGLLDSQTLRSLRVLEPESAALFMARWARLFQEPNVTGRNVQFNPDQADMRKQVEALIVYRQGQGKFRQGVLSAYRGRCCISGFDVHDALDAAHIAPYLGEHSNDVVNGLLLRSDLHALFDRGHIGIDSRTMRVVIATSLIGTAYENLQGHAVSLPQHEYQQPSKAALDAHRKMFGLK